MRKTLPDKKIDLKPSDKNDKMLAKILWLFADEYDLANDDLRVLLDVKLRTLQNARSNKTLPNSSNDRYRRISLLLGIKKNLEIIYPRNPEVRKNWLKVPRETFKGKSALAMIKDAEIESMARLFTVRRLLDMLRVGTINAIV